MALAHEILDFWFGEIGSDGEVVGDRSDLWWKKNPDVDEEIRRRFGSLIPDVAAGKHAALAVSPEGRLAMIIVLDQFTRNAFRDQPEAFAYDADARRLCLEGLEQGHDGKLAYVQRVFFYLPLEHAEDRALQAQCVELFQALAADVPDALRERYEFYLDFAVRHQAIIDRFGRFPHRNAVLGRTSTPEETAFLQEPGSSF